MMKAQFIEFLARLFEGLGIVVACALAAATACAALLRLSVSFPQKRKQIGRRQKMESNLAYAVFADTKK